MKHFKVGLVGGGSLDIEADVWAEKGSYTIFADLVGTGKDQSAREHSVVATRTIDIITIEAALPAVKETVN